MVRRLVLFAEAPLPGHTGGRLAEELGPVAAARIAEALVRDSVAACEAMCDPVQCDPPPRLVLAHSGGAEWLTPMLRADWRLIEQRGEELGDRIQSALEELAVADDDETVFIGVDCPQVTPQRIAQAFSDLEESDAVLGPCDTGGFYLIGMRGRLSEAALHGLRWKTADALGDLIAGLEGLGLTIARLTPGYNVDTAESLRRLARDLAADALDGVANVAKTLADLGL